MNILIVGNGFDLTHGFPTRYKQFLEYCKNYEGKKDMSFYELDEEFSSIISNNVWLNYFQDIHEQLGDTWIDLENEIREVISGFEELSISGLINTSPVKFQLSKDTKNIDRVKTFLDKYDKQSLRKIRGGVFVVKVWHKLRKTSTVYITSNDGCYAVKIKNNEESFEEQLYNELRAFVRAFEIYCICCVNSIVFVDRPIATDFNEEIIRAETAHETAYNEYNSFPYFITDEETKAKKASARVELKEADRHVKEIENSPKSFLERDAFDYVLSFNYTNTYERLYDSKKTNDRYCYIHGEAQFAPDENNMVFGINETLEDDQANRNMTWSKFKKYFQRIILATGSEYKDWIKKFPDKGDTTVHIVGCSLDKTDHEVFREFFDAKCKVIIYYFNEADYIDKVRKTIDIITKDELIKRVHGSDWSIRFVDQYGPEGLFVRK